MALLQLKNVNKRFGEKAVLKGLNLSVPEGSIYGFVGENGAGKTTTMKLILGLDTLDAGEILIDGVPVKYGKTATNQGVGYLPDVPEYYGYMTPTEYLTLCGKVTGMKRSALKSRISTMLKLVELPQNRRRIQGFSRGMKQRLGIAQALLNRPRLLICDEPTSALDPAGRSEFLSLLDSLRSETTILFSTHILTDVERICDRVGILNDGKLQVDGNLTELKQQYQQPQLVADFATETEAKIVAKQLDILKLVNPKQVRLPLEQNQALVTRKLLEATLAVNVMPQSVRVLEPTLEDIFMEVI
jgi:ABC-2 type transport system ATP-binding protein